MWHFVSPKIVFGEDALTSLGEISASRVLVVTDQNLVKMGLIEQVLSKLPTNVEPRVFDNIEPDPTLKAVELGVEVANDFKPDWIIGVGLDSDERGNPPLKFKDVFARAREEGYHLTMHCDVNQEDSVGHIWDAINEIGVERIDHGVNSLEDEALIAEIKRRDLALLRSQPRLSRQRGQEHHLARPGIRHGRSVLHPRRGDCPAGRRVL